MGDDTNRSTESLMARYQSRLDPAAFEAIVSRFLGHALGAARLILSDRALAEDAVQEAFLRVIRNRRQYDPARPFSHWFYAILRNACRDLLRRQAQHDALAQQAAARATDIEAAPADGPPDAEGLLDRLPAVERDVLVLRVIGGLGFEDIGIALGISIEAAKKRAQRGLRRLRASTPALTRP
jgi:RNA polymerase sigma-70 factor (ECF subfamily)